MADFSNKATGFSDPTKLPENEEQREQWLAANREWWEAQPMRYDFTQRLASEERTKDFFEEIDKRFFEASKDFAPYKHLPFERVIPYDFIKDKDVLEIGVGNGSHAQLLAAHAKSFSGIDLTEYAVSSTKKRFDLFGIKNAQILQMNAEEMAFPDNSFDFIWSWGVIHHSADTQKILNEIARVLRPGGRCTVMIYYRSIWFYYVYAGFFHGILKGYLLKEKSLHKVSQRVLDGAIARLYTIREWKDACKRANLDIIRNRIMGTATDLVILPPGKIKNAIISAMPKRLSRFLTGSCRMGYFLVSEFSKQ